MFIQDVILKIREPYTVQFHEVFKKVNQMETAELFQSVLKDLEDICQRMPYPPDKRLASRNTDLATTGCPHWINNYNFAGCTMCNYFAAYVGNLAKMKALRDRDVRLYARAVRYSFDLQVGENPEPFPAELMTANDTLNPEEFPDEVFEEVFAKGVPFKNQPMYLFETRPRSVNPARIRKWKTALGKNLSLEFGIEVSDDWTRNHWINKNMTNKEIEAAVEIVRKEGVKFGANLLIGIPGLTDRQSMELFYESVAWLEDLGVDHIICSPLAKIERTLQEFLYNLLQGNKKSIESGIPKGGQTGIPEIFTVIESVYHIFKENPALINRVNISFINFFKYLKGYFERYRKHPGMKKTIFRIAEALREFHRSRKLEILELEFDDLKNDKDYRSYKESIKVQKGCDHLLDTIYAVGEDIARYLWPENWQMKIEAFKKEFDSYNKKRRYGEFNK